MARKRVVDDPLAVSKATVDGALSAFNTALGLLDDAVATAQAVAVDEKANSDRALARAEDADNHAAKTAAVADNLRNLLGL